MKTYIIQLLLALAEKAYSYLKNSHKNNVASEVAAKIEGLEKLINLTGGSKSVLDEFKKQLSQTISETPVVQHINAPQIVGQLISNNPIGYSLPAEPKFTLLCKRNVPEAILPTRSEGNAGYDLYAIEKVIIPPLERRLVKTGLSMRPPVGYYGSIRDRSGVAYKRGGHVLAGVIDENYTGEVGIVLFNSDKNEELVVEAGDRPAQIVFEKYGQFNIVEVAELTETNRGSYGFGSSGT